MTLSHDHIRGIFRSSHFWYLKYRDPLKKSTLIWPPKLTPRSNSSLPSDAHILNLFNSQFFSSNPSSLRVNPWWPSFWHILYICFLFLMPYSNIWLPLESDRPYASGVSRPLEMQIPRIRTRNTLPSPPPLPTSRSRNESVVVASRHSPVNTSLCATEVIHFVLNLFANETVIELWAPAKHAFFTESSANGLINPPVGAEVYFTPQTSFFYEISQRNQFFFFSILPFTVHSLNCFPRLLRLISNEFYLISSIDVVEVDEGKINLMRLFR